MSSNLVPFHGRTNVSQAFQTATEQFRDEFARGGDFRGFAPSGHFNFTDAPNLELSASCPVLIVPSQDGTTKVAIDANADDLEGFQVNQIGDTVFLRQNAGRGAGSINISSVGGSVHISGFSGGSVIINGVRMDAGGFGNRQSTKMPRVVIAAPSGGNLEADMNGQATLLSAIFHNEAHLDLSGQCKVAVAAGEIDLETSGQGTVILNVGGGDLKVDTSGMGSCQAFGEFNNVKADLSGMGSIFTEGTVKGRYNADASGMGSIMHRGPIHGRVKKTSSGMAQIHVG